MRPGINWQPLLERGVRSSESIVVLIAADGLGPWEEEEMQTALQLAVKDKQPIIPTLLPQCPKQPELPLFLGNRTGVDMSAGFTDAGIAGLIRGITAKKPGECTHPRESTPPRPTTPAEFWRYHTDFSPVRRYLRPTPRHSRTRRIAHRR